MKRVGPLRRLCRLALLGGMLALVWPMAGHAAPTRPSPPGCDPFCGVLRFMQPTPRIRVQHADHPAGDRAYATRRPTVRIARAGPPPRLVPRAVYAVAKSLPRYGFLARRPPYYVVVYSGYGYGYYYLYPTVYPGY